MPRVRRVNTNQSRVHRQIHQHKTECVHRVHSVHSQESLILHVVQPLEREHAIVPLVQFRANTGQRGSLLTRVCAIRDILHPRIMLLVVRVPVIHTLTPRERHHVQRVQHVILVSMFLRHAQLQ